MKKFLLSLTVLSAFFFVSCSSSANQQEVTTDSIEEVESIETDYSPRRLVVVDSIVFTIEMENVD